MDELSAERLQGLLGDDSWRLTPATLAAKLSRGYWKPARHLLLASTAIATAVARGGGRLIINMPPRHGKSELTSIWTPIWCFDRDPTTRVMLASYGAELSTEFSRKVRDYMLEFGQNKQIRTRIRKDSQRVDRFGTLAGGAMYAVGVGGPLTGRGANVLLIDDYIKDFNEAASQTQRDKIYEWFISTAYPRLEPGGSIIIVATRWNIDDLAGRLKDLTAEKWTVIQLPAIAFHEHDFRNPEDWKPDPLGRNPGEPLWPERYPIPALDIIRSAMSNYYWQAEYQQKPIPSGSGTALGDAIQKVDVLPHKDFLQVVRFWDLAATHDGGDYTVGTKAGFDKRTGYTYIMGQEREQFGPGAVEQLIRKTAEADGPSVRIGIEQEPGASGKSIVQKYSSEILRGYAVFGDRPTGDSYVRAQPLYGAAENGHVFMLRAEWNQRFIDEANAFPDGDHDDQVISAVGAYNMLHSPKRRAGTFGREGVPADHNIPPPSDRGAVVTGVTWGR